MAKINWVFQDESGTNLNRYIATNVETGEQITFDLLRGGNISIIGTPLNAEKLNQLVNAINENYNSLSTLATQVSGNSNDIDELKTTTTNIGKAVDSVTKSVATNTSAIATNKSNIATNTNDIAGIKSTISGSLSGQINSALKQANENKTSISELDTKLQNAQKSINTNATNIGNLQLGQVVQENKITDIETRLDKLGFKSGTFSISALGYDMQTGLGISSSDLNKYIEYNTIRKQGKYCIALFKLDPLENGKVYSFTLSLHIPNGFVPKTTFGFYARVSRTETLGNIPVQDDFPLWVTNSNDKSVFVIDSEVLSFSMFYIGWETE